MRMRYTEKVDSHHTNPDYKCIIVEFLRTDENVRTRSMSRSDVLIDWLPTDVEMLALFKAASDISPTFKEKLRELMKTCLIT